MHLAAPVMSSPKTARRRYLAPTSSASCASRSALVGSLGPLGPLGPPLVQPLGPPMGPMGPLAPLGASLAVGRPSRPVPRPARIVRTTLRTKPEPQRDVPRDAGKVIAPLGHGPPCPMRQPTSGQGHPLGPPGPPGPPPRHTLDKRKARTGPSHHGTGPGPPGHIYQQLAPPPRPAPPARPAPIYNRLPHGFLPLQGSKSLGRLDGLKEVQRLVKYEQDRGWIPHQGWPDLRRGSQDGDKEAERAAQGPAGGGPAGGPAPGGHHPANGDLDRVQGMFPSDALLLYDDNPLAMKSKGLMSRRGSPAAKLSRALSTKAVSRVSSEDGPPGAPASGGNGGGSHVLGHGLPAGALISAPVVDAVMVNGEQPKHVPKSLRQFIMEAPTQFTTGVQGQERHLFLFSDVLLVAKPLAKPRGPGQYKLKDKVRVASLWLTADPQAVHEVCEADKSPETSFVLGWPTTNVVATFSTQAARDLWWNKLNEAVNAEAEHEPKSTNIQVVFYDMETNIEYCKTLCVRPMDSVQRCIQMALEHLEMQSLDPLQFQLWAKTPGDDSPYPLVGHERPFAIRMGCLRDHMNQEEGFDLDHCNNMYEPLNPRQRCQFILRNVRQMAELKKKPKSRKSPMRLRQVFKRTKSEVNVDAESAELSSSPFTFDLQAKKNKKGKGLKQRRSNPGGQDATDGGADEQAASGELFGVPLQRLWRESPAGGSAVAGLVVDDVVGELAKPIMALLGHVFAHGISTQGIFRRSANQRAVRELRRALDAPGTLGLWGDSDAEAAAAIVDKGSILTTSCLLKEFLRCLPVPLLVPELCADWLEAHHMPDLAPGAPGHPGVNQPGQQPGQGQGSHPVNPAKLQRYAAVVAMLPRCHRGLLAYLVCLLHHVAAHAHVNLMGPHNLGVVLAPSLLRAPQHAPKELEQVLTVSTPAIVSFLIEHCQQLFGPAVTRLLGEPPPPPPPQDSGAEESDSLHSGGLDSLEHLEPCPPPRKDKMSLSRDSGLTMSDSQLFTPDEEESGSTSSSGSGRPANRYKMSVSAATGAASVGAASAAAPGPPSGPPAGCRQYVRVYGGWEERRQGQAGLYSTCSSPRTAQLPSATSTGTGSPMGSPMGSPSPSASSAPASTTSSAPAAGSPFKREDWFRQRSALRRLASGGAGSPSSPSYSPSYSPSSSPGPQSSQNIYGNLGVPASSAARVEPAGADAPAPAVTSTATTSAPTATAPPRAAVNRRLEGARQDRLRRSASEESLLERRARPHPPCQPHHHPRPTQHSQHGPADRPLPDLPLQLHRGLYSGLGPGQGPDTVPGHPRIARSRSAYHLHLASDSSPSPTGRGPPGLRAFPLDLALADLDAGHGDSSYGYACVRGCADGGNAKSGGDPDESYDSSTLSDDDSTPHVSRSNSRSKEPWSPAGSSAGPSAGQQGPQAAAPPPLPPKLRHLPPVHVELGATMERRGRSRRRLPKPAARSKSLPPPPTSAPAPASPPPYRPPPYRPPPSVVPSHRAPITTYYLGARTSPNPGPSHGPSPLRAEEGESYV